MEKLICISILLIIVSCNSLEIHRKFEYKYSFKPPYLAQKDSTVPFWEYGGNAIASSENVRVAPSLRSQKGAIWTKSQTNFDWWEVDIVFRVSGRGRIGADGLAFWFTTDKGDYNGNVFGSSDKWTGLGVFFDSFDNDNKHNNPYISAVVNDGTKAFDHQNDGTTQLLSGCLRDFRNKPFPTRAKIEYYENTLTVLFHGGMTNNDQDYEMCMRAENVFLPKTGYFGISAATGGLADDHDVFHFLTTSLHPPSEMIGQDEQNLHVEDSQKLSQEYQEYQSKLDKQKEEYRRDHPEDKKADDLENWFESDNQRELRQIWQAQSATNDVLRDMTKKLDEIIGRQERTLGLLSASGGAIGGAVPQGGASQGGGGGGGGMTGTIMRHEVDSLMGQQNILVQTVKDIRGIVGDVYGRTDTILTNQARGQGSAHVQPAGYDVQSVIAEMRDGMNQVKQGVAAVGQRLASQVPLAAARTDCPNKSCLGMTPFLITVTIQLIIILGYSIYRDNREAQAKKFY